MLRGKFNDHDGLMTIGLLIHVVRHFVGSWGGVSRQLGRGVADGCLPCALIRGIPEIAYSANTHPLGRLGIALGLNTFLLLIS